MAFDMTALPLHPKAGKPAHAYIYRDAIGLPVLIANRYELPGRGKFFLPFDLARGDWKAPAIRPLYQLHRITAAAPEVPVLLVEGEKCADALTDLGFLATTSFGGAKALAKTDLAPLAGRRVAIWPDHDAPGRAYAAQAEAALLALGCEVAVLQINSDMFKSVLKDADLVELPQGWDAADAIAGGMNFDKIEHMIMRDFKQEIALNSNNSLNIVQNHKYPPSIWTSGTAPTARLSHRFA